MKGGFDGDQITPEELHSLFILLLVAGNETTRNAISHGLWALTQHPDQRRWWLKDIDGRAGSAVEEIVRWATPVIHMRRTAKTETELGGQRIAEGDKVVLFYCSANRDEMVFDRPYELDLSRAVNPHLSFGGPGAHFCLGANLARREVSVMWRELLSRVPDIEAAAQPAMLRSNKVNGIKHLPCRFTPASPSQPYSG